MKDKTITTTGLTALDDCRSSLFTARLHALAAADRLAGVRAARAHELSEKLADALVHVERLGFMVEGDIHIEGLV